MVIDLTGPCKDLWLLWPFVSYFKLSRFVSPSSRQYIKKYIAKISRRLDMMSHHITYREEFAKAPPKLCEVAGERERASILKGMA